MSWSGAKSAAENMRLNGKPGYLATITSADESDWILSNLNLSGGHWIGGFQDPAGRSLPKDGNGLLVNLGPIRIGIPRRSRII